MDHNCDQPTSTATNVVDNTMYYSANVPLWMQTAVANGQQIFGGKASEPETPWTVKNSIFTYPTCIWCPH